MEENIQKNVLVFKIIAFKYGNCKFSQSETGYLSSAVSVLTNTPKNSNLTNGDILETYPLIMIKDMVKVLSYRFHKCFGPFNMLIFQGCSETTLFREWSNQFFDSL